MGISSGLGAAALAPAGLSFRNKLINGGFDIWQRWVATSINVASGATGYTADRWFMSPDRSNDGRYSRYVRSARK